MFFFLLRLPFFLPLAFILAAIASVCIVTFEQRTNVLQKVFSTGGKARSQISSTCGVIAVGLLKISGRLGELEILRFNVFTINSRFKQVTSTSSLHFLVNN